MTDYRVVPQALRRNVKEFTEIADAWKKSREELNGISMADDDLGLLGGKFPKKHNEAVTEILQALADGFTHLNNAGTTLKKVADDYEGRDIKYYKQFGYLDQQR